MDKYLGQWVVEGLKEGNARTFLGEITRAVTLQTQVLCFLLRKICDRLQ